MKKIIIVLCAALLLTAAFAGCGKGGNEVFKDASPETSCLEIFVYDGERVSCEYLFDINQEKSLLEKLSKVSISETNYSADDIITPVYGIGISKKDGFPLACAFTNGLMITSDGKAYKFDFDFNSLMNDYAWTDKTEFETTSFFPCARELSEIGGRWNKDFLSKAKELTAPQGIEMKLISRESEKITVELTNNTSEEWIYGEHFAIQTKLDGEWYDIPMTSGTNWAFNDLAYILMPGQSQEKLYNISMYGELPEDGEYRFVMEELSVEI